MAAECNPPRAALFTLVRKGFKCGLYRETSDPEPRRPPSPLPQSQSCPFFQKQEWNKPHDIPTSSTPLGLDGDSRMPGMEARRNFWGRDTSREGDRSVLSLPRPSWPTSPLPPCPKLQKSGGFVLHWLVLQSDGCEETTRLLARLLPKLGSPSLQQSSTSHPGELARME